MAPSVFVSRLFRNLFVHFAVLAMNPQYAGDSFYGIVTSRNYDQTVLFPYQLGSYAKRLVVLAQCHLLCTQKH